MPHLELDGPPNETDSAAATFHHHGDVYSAADPRAAALEDRYDDEMHTMGVGESGATLASWLNWRPKGLSDCDPSDMSTSASFPIDATSLPYLRRLDDIPSISAVVQRSGGEWNADEATAMAFMVEPNSVINQPCTDSEPLVAAAAAAPVAVVDAVDDEPVGGVGGRRATADAQNCGASTNARGTRTGASAASNYKVPATSAVPSPKDCVVVACATRETAAMKSLTAATAAVAANHPMHQARGKELAITPTLAVAGQTPASVRVASDAAESAEVKAAAATPRKAVKVDEEAQKAEQRERNAANQAKSRSKKKALQTMLIAKLCATPGGMSKAAAAEAAATTAKEASLAQWDASFHQAQVDVQKKIEAVTVKLNQLEHDQEGTLTEQQKQELMEKKKELEEKREKLKSIRHRWHNKRSHVGAKSWYETMMQELHRALGLAAVLAVEAELQRIMQEATAACTR
ncbi:hypothetical protein MMPV_003884 [Pyropia vietnamensis]